MIAILHQILFGFSTYKFEKVLNNSNQPVVFIVDIIGQSIGRSDVVSKVEIIQIFPILEMSNLKHPTSNMKEQLSFFSFMLLDFSHLKIGAKLAQFSRYQN